MKECAYKIKYTYVPTTAYGTVLYDLKADTEEKAWENLRDDFCKVLGLDIGMKPTKDKFIQRGYKVNKKRVP